MNTEPCNCRVTRSVSAKKLSEDTYLETISCHACNKEWTNQFVRSR